jgi:hypothetical protein
MFTKVTALPSAVARTSGIWEHCFGHVSRCVGIFDLSLFKYSCVHNLYITVRC